MPISFKDFSPRFPSAVEGTCPEVGLGVMRGCQPSQTRFRMIDMIHGLMCQKHSLIVWPDNDCSKRAFSHSPGPLLYHQTCFNAELQLRVCWQRRSSREDTTRHIGATDRIKDFVGSDGDRGTLRMMRSNADVVKKQGSSFQPSARTTS